MLVSSLVVSARKGTVPYFGAEALPAICGLERYGEPKMYWYEPEEIRELDKKGELSFVVVTKWCDATGKRHPMDTVDVIEFKQGICSASIPSMIFLGVLSCVYGLFYFPTPWQFLGVVLVIAIVAVGVYFLRHYRDALRHNFAMRSGFFGYDFGSFLDFLELKPNDLVGLGPDEIQQLVEAAQKTAKDDSVLPNFGYERNPEKRCSQVVGSSHAYAASPDTALAS